MNVPQVLHMLGGSGSSSYASNSRLQEKAIHRTKPIVEDAIREVYSTLLPECLAVADLGCSSTPNTFLVISEIVDTIDGHCQQLDREPPEIQYSLNDLPGNDFNTLFCYSIAFEKYLQEERGCGSPSCYLVGVPGSFYKRLFPAQSAHFFHSSYCLIWLSQVPIGLENNILTNKGNIYITATSPPSVLSSYLVQFKYDFSNFLKLRYKELIFGGRMVLTFLGRKSSYSRNGELIHLYRLLAEALYSLIPEGLVSEAKMDTFNLPQYAPSPEEVKAVIEDEGSFHIDQLQTFESNWDPYDVSNDDIVFDIFKSGQNIANCIRAVFEPMLIQHFGEAIIDPLFSRFMVNLKEHLLKKKPKYHVLIVSLKKQR